MFQSASVGCIPISWQVVTHQKIVTVSIRFGDSLMPPLPSCSAARLSLQT
jgi:hypothetical protein